MSFPVRRVGGAKSHARRVGVRARVVGSDGSLTGFGGGIDMKVKLLEHEDVDVSAFYHPKRGTAL